MGNVLVVDDEPAIGAYLAKLITCLGHQAVTVLNAAETLEKLEHEKFHLIIADIRLPDAPNAHEWIQLLSAKAAGSPIVLISGAPTNEFATCATENGVMAFLSKPFELAFIKNILHTVFNTSP